MDGHVPCNRSRSRGIVDAMRIIWSWRWLVFALLRLVRGRPPALRARLSPTRTGGPLTPWESVRRPMAFASEVDASGSCLQHVDERIVARSLGEHGHAGWVLRRPARPEQELARRTLRVVASEHHAVGPCGDAALDSA